ncbi:hypothetical protein BH24CHL6_BH24CHL6_04020 [soil metagenome]
MKLLQMALLGLLLAAMLAACGATAAPAVPQAPAEADATIRSGSMEFDRDTVNVPAGKAFSLLYVNESPMPHNVSIYGDESLNEKLYIGEIIEEGSVVYDVPAMPAGEYYFHCDIHPEMSGSVFAR